MREFLSPTKTALVFLTSPRDIAGKYMQMQMFGPCLYGTTLLADTDSLAVFSVDFAYD